MSVVSAIKTNRRLARILAALAIFAAVMAACETGAVEALIGSGSALYAEFALYLIPYLIAGYDVLGKAARNIAHGRIFDENFLMSAATIGAFALVLFPEGGPHMAEGAAVMLFYQVGELFQDYAVDKSRASVASLMDIAPEHARIKRNGAFVEVDPYDVEPGTIIYIKPGERIPLDGTVVSGESSVDASALTGESLPRSAAEGDDVVSGCVNLTGALAVRTSKAYEDSTVARILELVENAADRKAKTESFITRFARYYTPIVCGAALALAVIPPALFGQIWSEWIERGLIFLVVSCPCALVISVPLSFFGGIGGASREGVLIKGSNYLEALANAGTVVFDKTGTLTKGSFAIADTKPEPGASAAELMDIAANLEQFSSHPIARSICAGYRGETDESRVAGLKEKAGYGITATLDGRRCRVGNAKLMAEGGVAVPDVDGAYAGTVLHVAADGRYLGRIVLADEPKPQSKQAISALNALRVKRTVMLTGDFEETARAMASQLGIDDVRAQLLPQDKVEAVETLMDDADRAPGALVFVGDGINDAPALTRADVGIAMGAMGSDAAIEAADVVLMDDDPLQVATAMRIARKTMGIVRQNIVFALGVKFAVLILAAAGIANMWLAVFADVGVAVLAILNAMRAMRVPRA